MESRVAAARKPWWWIFDPRRSLRARAALIFGGGTLLFALVLSWLTGAVFRHQLERQTGTAFETLAFQLSDKLDRQLYERYRTLLLASNLTTLRDISSPTGTRRRLLETLQESSPEFAWVGLTDTTGRIVAATAQTFEGESAELRGWFRGARTQPFLGNLHEIPELARRVTAPDETAAPTRFLDLAVPVMGTDGQFAGVLAAHVRWNWAHDVQLSVVPDVARRDRIGVTVYNASDVMLDSGGLGWTYPPESPSVGEGRRFRGWLIENTAVGMPFLTGFARSRGFREYRGLGWLTVVRQPIERAFAPVTSLRRTIAFWGLALAIVAATASWIIAGRHARRLRSIAAAADRIRAGDILVVLPRPFDESELSNMCRALGDLVEDLRAKPTAPPATPHTPEAKS